MTGRADATAQRLADLRKVLEISRAMAATESLDTLLGLVVDRSMELLHAERATVFLYDAASDELVSRIAAGSGEIRSPADRGIAGAAIRQGATILVANAYADPRFNPDVDRKTGFRTRNVLSMPLRDYQGDLVGVLQVLNKAGGAFDEMDVELGEVLAAQAGVAIQRARLIGHFLQKQEMERAMQIAREIQEALLPEPRPRICGYDVAGFCQPADQTGGDTYDFMPLPDGRWMLAVADATGHGIGPALVIAETRAMLRALSRHGRPDATAVLRNVNELLAVDLGDARFVTCFLGLLDPLVHRLSFASAGHGPLLFYRREKDSFEEVEATALPLGILAEAPFDEVLTRTLAPGDFAAVTTDGFFEASDPAGNAFGIERMLDLLRRDRDLPSERMIANLHAAVVHFTAGRPAQDDLTAVIVRRR